MISQDMFQSKVVHSQTEHFSVGVFFVIYLLLTLTCGFPILYMETILGQYARGGPVISWDVIPMFRGKLCPGELCSSVAPCLHRYGLLNFNEESSFFLQSNLVHWHPSFWLFCIKERREDERKAWNAVSGDNASNLIKWNEAVIKWLRSLSRNQFVIVPDRHHLLAFSTMILHLCVDGNFLTRELTWFLQLECRFPPVHFT